MKCICIFYICLWNIRSVIWKICAEVKNEDLSCLSVLESCTALKCLKIYTRVRQGESAYIRGLYSSKARMGIEVSSEMCADVYASWYL